VDLTEHSPTPVVSASNPKGQGRAPDGCISFNPSYIPKSDTFNQSGIYVRLCCGTSCVGHGADATGTAKSERIGFAPCDLETGVCQDVVADFNLDPTTDTEDPRAFYYESSYYLFSYSGTHNHTGCTGGSCTVRLQKTKTPLDAASYVNIGLYNWHRNGCCAMKPKGQKSYCIWGEGPSPFPGLGISYTTDIDQVLPPAPLFSSLFSSIRPLNSHALLFVWCAREYLRRLPGAWHRGWPVR
jgi:hypothetical protein